MNRNSLSKTWSNTSRAVDEPTQRKTTPNIKHQTSNLDAETLRLAELLWDYHHLHHVVRRTDCILALGSHDLRVADRAAELYLKGMATLLIFSGGLGNLTRNMWTVPEAVLFAERAVDLGVPSSAILVEDESTNTGENILYTQALLNTRNRHPQSFIVVQKPYMERRAFATFKKHWPDKELIVTSPQISFLDYPNNEISMERVINIMVGDLQRIKLYPERGFQIEQEIPEEVLDAYDELVKLGYTKHLTS